MEPTDFFVVTSTFLVSVIAVATVSGSSLPVPFLGIVTQFVAYAMIFLVVPFYVLGELLRTREATE
jgi:hypothetical protein